MLWELRAQRDGFAVEALEARGAPIPEWAKDRPRLTEGDEWYIHAFWELSSTRQVGFSPGPIPWHHIVDYGSRAGLDEDMIDVAVRVIRALDHAYLGWVREQDEKKRSRERKGRARDA